MPAAIEIRMDLDKAALAQVNRAMQILPEKIFQRVMKSAASFAMTPVVRAARANAEAIADDGDLAQSIVKKRKIYRASGVVFVIVGPEDKVIMREKNGRMIRKNPANYAHFVEDGTAPHMISSTFQGGVLDLGFVRVTGSVQHPGAAAHPVFRPAYYAERTNVVRRYQQKMVRGIEKEVRKLGKGG